MAAHKGSANLRPRCTRSGSSVAAIPVYHSTSLPVYQSTPVEINHLWDNTNECLFVLLSSSWIQTDSCLPTLNTTHLLNFPQMSKNYHFSNRFSLCITFRQTDSPLLSLYTPYFWISQLPVPLYQTLTSNSRSKSYSLNIVFPFW
jgi:hypothetical protein